MLDVFLRLAGPLEAVLRIVVGGIFVYASLGKIAHPGDFAQSVFYYRILPASLLHPFALLMPWLELVVGLSLILGIARRGAALLASLMTVMFIAAIGLAMARDLDISCGCFGTGHGVGMDLILRDLLLLLGCLLILFRRESAKAPPPASS